MFHRRYSFSVNFEEFANQQGRKKEKPVLFVHYLISIINCHMMLAKARKEKKMREGIVIVERLNLFGKVSNDTIEYMATNPLRFNFIQPKYA